MKKIYLFIAACVVSFCAYAEVSVTVNPKVIDFGTVELDENGEAQPADYMKAELDYTLAEDVYNVFLDTLTTEDPLCEFEVVADSESDFWYDGSLFYGEKETTVWVSFYAVAAGEYEMKYRFYTWETVDWENKVNGDELTVKVKVIEHVTTAIGNTAAEVKAQKMLRDGQVLIVRNGNTYTVTGSRVR